MNLRSALRYVRGTPELLIPLLMMALVGTISFNFQVLLPLLADFTWNGTATTYALLTASMGVGSVAGALAAGARGRVSPGLLVVSSLAFGVSMLLAAAAPTLELQILALIPLGAASVTFAAGVNSALQIHVEPTMRGRVMALYSVVFLGSTPIGAPLVGWLAEAAGPRAGTRRGCRRGPVGRRRRRGSRSPGVPRSRSSPGRTAGGCVRRSGSLQRATASPSCVPPEGVRERPERPAPSRRRVATARRLR